MSRFSRTASKYRHVQGAVSKKELWYPDLKPTSSSDSNSIGSSSLWIAVTWSSAGNIALLDINQVGKRKTNELPMISAHASDVSDLCFSPFDDSLLGTTADDGVIKLWKIPNEMKENILNPTVNLTGHKRGVDSFKFHPTSSNLLASGSSDKTVRVWDLESGKEAILLDGLHSDAIQSVSWNWDGSLLATTCKDKKLRIVDPRSKQVSQTGEGHQGVKRSTVIWLGSMQRLATVGFSKFRDRQFAFWDPRDLSKSLSMSNLDASTGTVDLFYDNDSALLFLAGKGDGSIRVYEIYESGSPFCQELTGVNSDQVQKSTTCLPKRACDLMNTEIVRLLKLTSNAVVPVSFSIPRKTKSEFQEDLYPPTPSTEPSLTAQEWFSGETRPPKLVQLKPSLNPNKFWVDENDYRSSSENAKPIPIMETTSSKPMTARNENIRNSNGNDDHSNSSPSNNTSIVVRNSEIIAETSEEVKKIQIVRSSKFRHISGYGTKPEACYTNLQFNSSSPNSSVIKANPTFFVLPWRGTGGQIAIIPLAKHGRQSDKLPTVECGSDCLDFDLNPFDERLLATVTESAHVQLWKIPIGGLKETIRTPDLVLKGHTRRVTSVDFHPTANNVLLTSGGDFTVRFWDIEKALEKLKLDEEHSDMIMSLSWNWNADRLATASKDKFLRLWDPRSRKLSSKVEAVDGVKGFKVCWLGAKEKLVTVGFSKSSQRQISLFDARNLTKPIVCKDVDQGSGIITPFYDPDTGVTYLAGKGDGNIKMYELNEEEPFVHFLSEYRSMVPAFGLAPLPKTCCNVKDCEVATFLKLCGDYVEQIHFKIPRTRTEFFQDDLFPPTRKIDTPLLTADQWFSGETKSPSLISLQPADMQLLSESPIEHRAKKYDFKEERSKDNNEFTKEKLLDKYYQHMGAFSEQEHQVLKQDQMEGASAEEWDD